MAEMRPPPPRYRIVEHKGRLIATDTWAENRPARAEVPPPRSDKSLPRVSGSPRPVLQGARPEPGSNWIDALGAALVVAVCAGSVDPAGQPILSTYNYYDIKGPREIALNPAGAQRLARWLSAMLVVVVAATALASVFTEAFVLLAIMVGLGVSGANTTARPAITRWLDRLGES